MMESRTTIAIPGLVRIKSGALEKLGTYCSRYGFRTVVVVAGSDIPAGISESAGKSLAAADVQAAQWFNCAEASFERAQSIFINLPGDVSAVIGLGGGMALDVAKYVAFLARLPYLAVPTSPSNNRQAAALDRDKDPEQLWNIGWELSQDSLNHRDVSRVKDAWQARFRDRGRILTKIHQNDLLRELLTSEVNRLEANQMANVSVTSQRSGNNSKEQETGLLEELLVETSVQ